MPILSRLTSIPPGSVNPYIDRKSTRLNSSHVKISYAVFYLKKEIDDALASEQPENAAGLRERLYPQMLYTALPLRHMLRMRQAWAEDVPAPLLHVPHPPLIP